MKPDFTTEKFLQKIGTPETKQSIIDVLDKWLQDNPRDKYIAGYDITKINENTVITRRAFEVLKNKPISLDKYNWSKEITDFIKNHSINDLSFSSYYGECAFLEMMPMPNSNNQIIKCTGFYNKQGQPVDIFFNKTIYDVVAKSLAEVQNNFQKANQSLMGIPLRTYEIKIVLKNLKHQLGYTLANDTKNVDLINKYINIFHSKFKAQSIYKTVKIVNQIDLQK